MTKVKMGKTLQELTIKSNFLFAAVMLEAENCRGLLERVLEFPIAHVEVDREKSMVYHPEYKGVRLDVYAKDENHTRYNVEMQVRSEQITKRARYYHSQMDMELLAQGTAYEELPDSYVIFICDFDPFGKGLYRYTRESRVKEVAGLEYPDGIHTIYLSTVGKQEDLVPESLVKFLKFVHADLEESMKDFADEYVSQLQQTISRVKSSREMKEQYMVLEELLKEERKAGRDEGISYALFELLGELGTIPEDMDAAICAIDNSDTLQVLFKEALHADSLEQFAQVLQKYQK